jgi:hypothetical protein
MSMRRSCASVSLLVVAAVAVSGCMPEQVKQIESNKTDYMQSHFAVTDIPQQVADTIKTADSSAIGFQQMKLTLALTVSRTSDGQVNHFVNTSTYTAAGGPYVQILDVLNNNGVPFQEDYSLTYRGLLFLRTQQVQLNATNSNFIFAIHSLQPVAAWPAGGAGTAVDFHYQEGLSTQIMNFEDGAMSCTFGSVFSASEINPALTGDARHMHCTALNNNGVVTSQSEAAWLEHYGIVLVTQVSTSVWVRSWKVTQVEVQ